MKNKFLVVSDIDNDPRFPVGKLIAFEHWIKDQYRHIVPTALGEMRFRPEYFKDRPDIFIPYDPDNDGPVYKVIADFPGNRDWPVGSLVRFERWAKTYWRWEVTDCQGTRSALSEYFDKFPHIFQRIG